MSLPACADYNYDRLCFREPFGSIVAAGDTARLQAGYFENRTSRCVAFDSEQFRWTSSNQDVLTVSHKGRLRAVAPGSARVRVAARRQDDEAARASKEIRVVPPVASLMVRPANTQIAVGDTARFHVIAYDSSGTVIPGIPSDVESSNYAVGKYEGNKVIGLGPGKVEVRSRALIGAKSATTLTVVDNRK